MVCRDFVLLGLRSPGTSCGVYLWLCHTSRLPVFKCLSDPLSSRLWFCFRAPISENMVRLAFTLITTLTFTDPLLLLLFPILLLYHFPLMDPTAPSGRRSPLPCFFWLKFLSKSSCMLLLDKWPLRFQKSFHFSSAATHSFSPLYAQCLTESLGLSGQSRL